MKWNRKDRFFISFLFLPLQILPAAATASEQNPKETPKISSSPPLVADVTRMEPPPLADYGGYQPLLFLAKPPGSASERPRKQKPSDRTRRPRSRGHRATGMGLLPPPRPPGIPVRKAGDSRRTVEPDAGPSPADRTLTRPQAAASWAIVPTSPSQAVARQKRSRLAAVGLSRETAERTARWSRLGSESTRVGPPTHRVKTEPRASASTFQEAERAKDDVAALRRARANGSSGPHRRLRDGRTQKMDSSDQTAKTTGQKESLDRGSTARIERSFCARDCPACTMSTRDHRKPVCDVKWGEPDQTVRSRRLTNPKVYRVSSTHQSRPRQRERSLRQEPPTSSETSCQTLPSAKPARHSSSSSSACSSGGVALPEKPRRRTVSRQDSVGPVVLYKRKSTRRVATPTRYGSSPELMIPRRKPPLRPPIVARRQSKGGESTAIAKVDLRDKKAEKEEGRLRRLKHKLGLIFHHHHHHYHHDHPPPDDNEHGGRGRRERRHHRSLGELLGGIFHHKRAAEGGQRRRPPQQGQRNGYLHMLLEGLLRHVLRVGKRRKQRPPQVGGAGGRVAAKKLHWWQRIRRRRRGSLRLGTRRRPRLRLGFGRKAEIGRGGSKKKK